MVSGSWVLNKVYNLTIWRLGQGIFLGRMPWTGYKPWWCVDNCSFILQIKKAKNMFLKRLSHLYNVFHTTTKTVLSYSATARTGALGRLSNHNSFWKQKILKFFCKRTDNIHKFECFFLETSGKFKRFNSFQRLHSWTLNSIVPFAKNLESFVFKKPCDWIVFFQVPRFE